MYDFEETRKKSDALEGEYKQWLGLFGVEENEHFLTQAEINQRQGVASPTSNRAQYYQEQLLRRLGLDSLAELREFSKKLQKTEAEEEALRQEEEQERRRQEEEQLKEAKRKEQEEEARTRWEESKGRPLPDNYVPRPIPGPNWWERSAWLTLGVIIAIGGMVIWNWLTGTPEVRVESTASAAPSPSPISSGIDGKISVAPTTVSMPKPTEVPPTAPAVPTNTATATSVPTMSPTKIPTRIPTPPAPVVTTPGSVLTFPATWKGANLWLSPKGPVYASSGLAWGSMYLVLENRSTSVYNVALPSQRYYLELDSGRVFMGVQDRSTQLRAGQSEEVILSFANGYEILKAFQDLSRKSYTVVVRDLANDIPEARWAFSIPHP